MTNVDWIASSCDVPNCDNPIGTGGLCEMHWKRHRFLETGTVTEDANGCWNWNAAVERSGYGRFRVNHRIRYAHAVAYELWVGEIPAGMLIRHTDAVCRGNCRCVNPDHLMIGTHADNMADKIAAGTANGNPVGARGYKPWVRRKALQLIGLEAELIDFGIGDPIQWRMPVDLAMTMAECRDELGVSIQTLCAWKHKHFEMGGPPARERPDDNHDLFD